MDDPLQPHCAIHAHFVAGCTVCKQACANFQPYPVRKPPPSTRSFGFTDDITASKLRGPAVSRSPWNAGGPGGLTSGDLDTDVEVSLSLTVIRFVLRLIWPFSRIL